MKDIIWKPVVGYEGLYEVSNTGIVRGLERFGNRNHTFQKELKPSKNKRYEEVKLYKDGGKRTFKVHRLVAMAFVPNVENKPQINHIDGNKNNNNAENLEWCTQSENNRHAIDNNLNSPYKMIESTKKEVLQLSLDGKVIKKWETLTEASRTLGLQISNISHCCKGRIRQTGGYKWRLVSES